MEKKWKPVPDVEALQYKGTPENPDIKIFVSHRIDLDSETIDNPLYIPVRCGAVYDEREDVTMLGDDTGDNISEKRMSYCELTVQYWAWKNIKADYYGLCHYRRYISFSNEVFASETQERNNGCISEEYISSESIKRHHLDADFMREEIKKYDLIVIDPIDLQDGTNYSAMANSPDYHNMDDVDFVIDIIERKYPKMIKSVEKYMRHDHKCWLYNCFIMSAELFDIYNTWLFDILHEVETHVDFQNYSQQMYRTPGTIGERLLGIFITYILQEKKYKVHFQQLIFFENTEKIFEIKPAFAHNNVAIASNFDNAYAPVFSVLLQSIILHANPSNNYDIVILSQDITNSNKQYLESMVNLPNFSLRFYNPKKYLANIDLYVANSVYTGDMYVRVLIPHILPEYDKILVLDADMICKEDIATLFNIDLCGYWAGAVQDVVYYGYLNGTVPDTLEYAKKVLKLSNPYHYCNTGVILFDCRQIRNNFTLEYLQNYIHTHQFRVYEQDTLNVLLDGKIHFLSPEWNMFTYTNSFIEKCVAFAPLNYKEQYLLARKSPKILHYAAHPKPWWTGDGDFSIDFWQVARHSPFYEILIAKMIARCNISQNNLSIVPLPYVSLPRKIADIIMPKGSFRRKLAKKILPKGSKRWEFFRSIYNRIMHIS